MLEEITYFHEQTVSAISSDFKRHLYGKIAWNSPCICIAGARGTGKTTLLLQHFNEKYGTAERCLYVSADNIQVAALGLLNTAKEYFKYGGEALIIDEIHKYPEWQIELKNIIDVYRGKKIYFSGSSSLNLHESKADLSRRTVYYTLTGLSFREFLNLEKGVDFPVYALEEILADHVRIARELASEVKILKLFGEYLVYGYYPFFREDRETYFQKLTNIIEKVLYEDIAVVGNLKRGSLIVLKKMLWIVATSAPFSVNIEKMSREFGISKEYVYVYLDYLERSGLLGALRGEMKGYKAVRKPEKLFMENTNLLHAINHDLKTSGSAGMIRETFFVNQLKSIGVLSCGKPWDFTLDGRFHFEVGGKGKNLRQIFDVANSYVVSDQIEIGFDRKIPLYLFGFLY
jgi:uncharacterized protein